MALYTIDYLCGHREEVYGTNVNGDRERTGERLARGRCLDCRWRDKRASATEWAQALGLPNLEGTEKQVTWANALRREALEYQLKAADKFAVAAGIDEHRARQSLINEAHTHITALWWIDNRYLADRSLWPGAAKQLESP